MGFKENLEYEFSVWSKSATGNLVLHIEILDTKGATQIIRAQVPMSEMLTYQNDLTSMTQGRASFTMEFDHYDYVPQQQADKIIAAAKAARTGEEEEEE